MGTDLCSVASLEAGAAPRTVGVALAGGGARGMAHLGVLKALSGVAEISHIAGSSAGALAGAAWAAGHSVETITEVARAFRPFRPWRTSIWQAGMLDANYFREVWYELIPETFEDLEIPLSIVATNIGNGEPHLFTSGPLREVVFASCALPPLYGPVEVDGEYFMDGGLSMNLPVSPLVGQCDVTVASEINPRTPSSGKPRENTMDLMNRALETLFMAASRPHQDLADLVITPSSLQEISILDQTKVDEAYEAGLEAAHRALEEPEARTLLGLHVRPDEPSVSCAGIEAPPLPSDAQDSYALPPQTGRSVGTADLLSA